MQSISSLYEKLIARLPVDPPYLLVIYKVAIAVAGFFIIWMLLRWIMHFVERRLRKFEFVQVNAQAFQIIRRVLFLALLLVVGTSATVAPASQIPFLAKHSGALIAEFNTTRTLLTSTITDFFVEGPAGTTLPILVDALKELTGD